MPNAPKNPTELLTAIARRHLLVETLESRNRDCLDFYDCGVSNIKAALEAAYAAGLAGRTSSAEPARRAQGTARPRAGAPRR